MSVMEGSLSKWTNVMIGWQYRWFVLDENAGLLSYYTSKEKMMRGVRRGCVRLKGAVIGIDDEDDSTFTITVDHKTFHFQARDAEEREKWVRALEDTILRHSSRMRWETNRAQPTIADFDNKVCEADAYLQIMIEQTKKLENRITNISDPEEQEKYKIIHEHSNAMLDNIKHSIVLLQIAKNTAHPVNGIYQGPGIVSSSGSPVRNAGGASISSLVVPETSYSSSEGEDDFFDANDSPFTSNSQISSPTGIRTFTPENAQESSTKIPKVPLPVGANIPAARKTQASTSNSSPDIESNVVSSPPIRADGSLDYDALYEEEIEEDASLIESNGSVVTHLISQIKIGMDLTKVVLPTFILERRSLLEMYADYFAHPDFFVSIADLKDPRDRMVQVVKWYLSSYHAGRKGSVAKKPYNPIIGEVFRCYWDIPNENSSTTDLTPTEDGPVPWATRDQLSFTSEQVSHHPPVSAFYAEHYNKKISFCAHVYTKSKFLGLSVCVYNIGQGIINVLNYNEQYILTFPNGYGRSILTIPWIELGGSVKITCPQTNYHADVEFLTKPFYSNKKHKITADVFAPNDKTPFLRINGEWNGVMEAKWHEGKTDIFVDVNKLSVVKKKVSPIASQEENESRRLWKEVTAGLRFNDIEKATQAKCELEQRQRNEAKERLKNNEKWETKLFKPTGENWVYINPLEQRLTEPTTRES